MPDISGLNGGVVKATPDATDLLPIQEVSGLTKPVSIASVATAAAALVPIATPSVAGKMSAADKTKLDGLTSGGGGGGGTGSIGATTSGTNSATPAIGTIVTYTVVASSGLAVGQYYAFNGVSGTFLCTSTPSATTANFQNIDGTVGVAIADATKIIATGKTGATGTAGTNGTNGTGSGGGVSSWQLKTANYTALPGDKLRLDATASDIVITLPSTPNSTDADILFQRLELGANKVLLRSGANKFNTQSNQDGVFAPATTNLIEGISYANSAIGWLNQHNRLTFQAYVSPGSPTPDPLFSKVKALLSFNGDLIDRSSTPHIFADNTGASTYANSNPFGELTGKSIALNGSTAIQATSADFVIPTNTDFCYEGWVNYATAPNPSNGYHSPAQQYLLGLDSQAISCGYSTYNNSNSWYFNLGNVVPSGASVAAPIPIAGTWYFWQIQRNAGVVKFYFNGAPLGSVSDSSTFGSAGELRIGNIIAGVDTAYGTIGNFSETRLTVGAVRPTVVPTARFPRSA